MRTPIKKAIGIQMTMDKNGSTFKKVMERKAPYIPNMTISPWAMLMMRITPKITVKPTPIIA
jgi:hypothetical protein